MSIAEIDEVEVDRTIEFGKPVADAETPQQFIDALRAYHAACRADVFLTGVIDSIDTPDGLAISTEQAIDRLAHDSKLLRYWVADLQISMMKAVNASRQSASS